MCGIAGIIGIDDRKLIEKMTCVLQHRGPDDKGFFVDNGVSLGFRRLSIIDLETGNQPIRNENGTLFIVFNGEIYNYKKLRKELEAKGHRFYTNSDTETIVHLYEEEKENCVKKLRGMFAFAIWDSENKKLFLARDRAGIKPLYYTQKGGVFLFASEIKSLLEFEEIERAVNIEAMHEQLSFGYVSRQHTMFRGINKLLPGHLLVLQDNSVKIEKYWELAEAGGEKKSDEYYFKKFAELLEESVKMRLMSDVPLGTCLSGGIDSSTITAIASSIMEEPVKTFSLAFEDAMFDESGAAKVVSNALGTEHNELLVKSSAFSFLPEVIWHFDSPLTDPSAIARYLLAEHIKKNGVSVVLCGDGSDELLLGYPRHKKTLFREWFWKYWKNMPAQFRGLNQKIVEAIPLPKRIKRNAEFMLSENPSIEKFMHYREIFGDEEKEKLFSAEQYNNVKDFSSTDSVKYFVEDSKMGSYFQKVKYLDFASWLPNDCLLLEDRTSMAFSVENRVPYLDHEFIEFAWGMPPRMGLRNNTNKFILRKTASRFLPKEIVNKSKQGLMMPLAAIIRENSSTIGELLHTSSIMKQFFDSKYIEKLISFRPGQAKPFEQQEYKLWSLICLALWHRIFIVGDHKKKPKIF